MEVLDLRRADQGDNGVLLTEDEGEGDLESRCVP